MSTRAHRVLPLVVLALLASASATRADATKEGAKDGYYLAVVTGTDVYVRSGPADSYYPFGRLSKGAVVKVIGEKYNWARVMTEGPAFRNFFGYIREDSADTSAFRVDPATGTGRTLGRVDLLAPNLNTDFNPNDSWKRILDLQADVELCVLETIETERETVLKVELPAEAEGWISAAFLQPATAEQTAAWMNAIRGLGPEAGTERVAALPAAEIDTLTVKETKESLAVVGAERLEEVSGAQPETPTAAAAVGVVEPFLPRGEYPEMERLAEKIAAREAIVAETSELRGGVTLRGPAEPWTRVAGETTRAADGGSMTSSRLAFDELELAYQRLRDEPIETAEVLPLRQLYLNLAQRLRENPVVARYAGARAEQLGIWADLQKRRTEIDQLRYRVKMTATETEAVRIALRTTGEYVGVGRLTPSMIYRGGRLPTLFRLQDPATGRTIAYLREDLGFDLAGMIGQIVGVVGETRFDEGLRLNLIDPGRIDLLTPTG